MRKRSAGLRGGGDREGPAWVRAMVRGLVRHPWLATGLLTLATVGALFYGRGIEIRSDMEGLFPEDSPNVVRARRAREIVGSRSEMIVLLGHPSAELKRELAGELAAALEADEELVADVEWRRDIALFEDNALLFLSPGDLKTLDREVTEAIADATRKELEDDFEIEPSAAAPEETAQPAPTTSERLKLPSEAELRERLSAQDLQEFFESPDGEVLALKVYPTFPPARADLTVELGERIHKSFARLLAAHPGQKVELALEGDYAHMTEAVAEITSEATWAFFLALAGVAALLLLYFRRVRALLVMLLTLVASTVWTFAFARLAVGHLNLVTVAIFSIVVGLGIDFVLHATSRTDEAVAEGLPLSEALPVALARLGGAMLWAAVCATATFFALVIFDFRGFSQFGLIAGVGGLLCLAGAYIVYPPLEILAARIAARIAARVARRPHRRPTVSAPAPAPAGPPGPDRPPSRAIGWLILALVAAATAISISWLPDLELHADMRQLRASSTEVVSELRRKYLGEAAQRSTSPALVITEGLSATRRVHRHMAARVDSEPLLQGVMSIYTFVPDDQEEKLAIIREVKRKLDLKYGLLDEAGRADADRLLRYLEPRAFGVTDLPPWLLERFTDTEGHLGRYVLLHIQGTKSDARRVVAIQDAFGTIEVDGSTYYATATWFILGDAYTTVRREGPLAVALGAFIVLLILGLDLRNVRDVLTVFIPLVVGFVVFLGVATALKLQLNIINVVVLPTVFGMAVDTAIHLVHRLNEGDGLQTVFRTTGRAAAVSVATDTMGFAALVAMSNEGLRSIGILAVTGLITLYVVNLALIAALVAVGFKRPAIRPAPQVALAPEIAPS